MLLTRLKLLFKSENNYLKNKLHIYHVYCIYVRINMTATQSSLHFADT